MSKSNENQTDQLGGGTNISVSLDLEANMDRWQPPVVDETDLRLTLDRVSQELLQARDALIGNESEVGVLRAKLTELKAELAARDREVSELSAELVALTAKRVIVANPLQKAESVLRPAARQLKSIATRAKRT